MTRRAIDKASLSESSIDILDGLREDLGIPATLLQGATGRWSSDELTRTGSLGLDMAIGIGGLPRGKIIEISGEESSGKTTLALHITREFQAAGRNVVYIDSEYALDPTYCTKLGIDLGSMILSQPNNLEQGLNQMIYLMEVKRFDGLIVLDSIPSLLPKTMMEADAESEGRRAATAAVYSRMLPRIKKLVRESNATLFMVNQTRSTMATNQYQKQTDTPGGKALKFAFDLRFEVRRTLEGKNNDTGIDYQTCDVTVIKNKVGSPFAKGSFIIWKNGTGINWAFDVVETAKNHGIVLLDQRYSDGKLIKKKNYRTLVLSQEIYDSLVEDYPDLDAVSMEVEDFDEETGEAYTHDVIYIEKYYDGKFNDYVCQFPNLIEYIEERTLALLDQGAILSRVNESAVEVSEAISEDDISEDDVSDNE